VTLWTVGCTAPGTRPPIGASSHRVPYVRSVTIKDLGTLPGDVASEATGVNDNGQLVGFSTSSSGTTTAFLWDPISGMQSLGTLGGASSAAAGINTFGSVVGHSQTSRDHEDHAFLWDPATFAMRDLAPLNDQIVPSIAERINDAGTMVGSTGVTGPANPLAVYWDAGSLTMHTIPVNSAYPDSPALGNDINNSGEMVGQYVAQNLAFTYAHGAVKTFTVFVASNQSATGSTITA
jgi:probable HAF family extracellular repeat protein